MLNPNEAPPGYIAVDFYPAGGGCSKCAFRNINCSAIACTSETRVDRTDVHFLVKPKQPVEKETETYTLTLFGYLGEDFEITLPGFYTNQDELVAKGILTPLYKKEKL